MTVAFPVYDFAKTIQEAIVQALPSGTPGAVLVDKTRASAIAEAARKLGYVLAFGGTTYEGSDELGLETQEELWQWSVFLFIGKGRSDDETLKVIQEQASAVQGALVGLEVDASSGALERGHCRPAGFTTNGVVFEIAFSHTRYTGEEP